MAEAGTRVLAWGGLSRPAPEPPWHVDARRAGSRAMGRRRRALAASLLPAGGRVGTRGHPQALQHGRAQGDRLSPGMALGFRVCTEGELLDPGCSLARLRDRVSLEQVLLLETSEKLLLSSKGLPGFVSYASWATCLTLHPSLQLRV